MVNFQKNCLSLKINELCFIHVAMWCKIRNIYATMAFLIGCKYLAFSWFCRVVWILGGTTDGEKRQHNRLIVNDYQPSFLEGNGTFTPQFRHDK